ncbi:MAG: PRC-barrel domain-containing protein [Paracoccaceae bacterium]
MKNLLATTAILVGLGLPASAIAQTSTNSGAATSQDGSGSGGFMAGRAPMDVLASDLVGQPAYARRSPAPAAQAGSAADPGQTTGTQTTAQPEGGHIPEAYAARSSDGTNNLAMMSAADLEGLDNIGEVSDIVLSNDGRVQALVVNVGGFLGSGNQDVALTMDQVSFAADSEDPSRIYVVVTTPSDTLANAPAFSRDRASGQEGMQAGGQATQGAYDGATSQGQAAGTGRTAFVAPTMARDGYDLIGISEISADQLVGQTVFGTNEGSVGTISDLILDEGGAIQNVIIDFGGFLGIGSSQVSVGFDELTFLSNAARSDLRVYIDATKEQVQAQPQYRPSN